MKCAITCNGFVVCRAVMQAKFGPKYITLLKKLTATYRPEIGPPVVIKMYSFLQHEEVMMRIPRAAGFILVHAGILAPPSIEIGPLKCLTATAELELYDNQKIIVDHLCDTTFTRTRVESGSAVGILNMKAGLGKTFVAAGLIARTRLRTLYVVLNKPLLEQCRRDLTDCFGKHISVEVFSKKCITSADVTIIIINSALLRPPAFFATYSLMILDEVQAYCTDLRRRIFTVPIHAILGMSATTEDRANGFDIIAHKELAYDNIIRAELVPGFECDVVAFDCIARVINYYGPDEFTKNLTHDATGRVFTHYMHTQCIEDVQRIALVSRELVALYDWVGSEGVTHNIYVFAEEVNVLAATKAAFAQACASRADVIAASFAPEVEMFIGGMKVAEIEAAVARARVLFATYAYAGTGVSIPKMTAMIFATPRKANMKQVLARILRRGSDLRVPRVVVDVVDARTALSRQATVRREAYAYYGFKIHREKLYAVG